MENFSILDGNGSELRILDSSKVTQTHIGILQDGVATVASFQGSAALIEMARALLDRAQHVARQEAIHAEMMEIRRQREAARNN